MIGRRCWLAVAALALACSPTERAPDARLSALLVTLDTTRADALGCFGGKAGLTPHLDQLAAESVAYDWARTVTPTTLPAHATILTGLYPHRHTVRDNGLNALPASATTLAELLGERGWSTAAFVSASVLDRAFGLDQGFASYEEPTRRKQVVTRTTYATRAGRETAERACKWLAALDAGEPFFAWVHFFDPHRPYHATREQLERAEGDPYHACVAAADAALGSILAKLREQGRLDRTVIVVVADHGEGLGEHGEDTHAAFVYDSTLRVPLLVRHPDGSRAGERSDETVSVVDVLPTLCEALGVAAPPGIDGTSLWSARLPEERGVYFESFYGYLRYGQGPIAGWADRNAKYIHSAAPQLFEPRADRGELDDLLARGARDVAAYRERMSAVLAEPALEASGAEIDAATRASLRELGYADATGAAGPLPSPLESSARPSPHACAAEIAQIEEALRVGQKGQFPRAIELLNGVLARRPDQPFALEYLGYYLLAGQRVDEAAAALERALAIGVERGSVHRQLAECRIAQGRADQAQAELWRAIELDPRDVEALRRLRELLQRAGDEARAERVRVQLQRALGY